MKVLFYFVSLLAVIHSQYVPITPTISLLKPQGLRMAIPGNIVDNIFYFFYLVELQLSNRPITNKVDNTDESLNFIGDKPIVVTCTYN
jgi:hypothetical protein